MFLMHRVELKVYPLCRLRSESSKFLMYRVELKGTYFAWKSDEIDHVPNVPCGVESSYGNLCPVEGHLFLMYRVELKVQREEGFSCKSSGS